VFVVDAANVVDFHGYPSNFHKCPHPLVDVSQPLESWYHVLLTLYLCSFSCFSYKHDICGASTLYLLACTSGGTADGATFPFIILVAYAFVPSCSF